MPLSYRELSVIPGAVMAWKIILQLMEIGVIGVNGANVQQTVVEELRPGAEPAVTLHQLTGEQNVWEMLLKHSLATPTPVQVRGL